MYRGTLLRKYDLFQSLLFDLLQKIRQICTNFKCNVTVINYFGYMFLAHLS